MKKRLILLKKSKLALNGVSIREYKKGDMITVSGQLADNLINAKLVKEWKPRLEEEDPNEKEEDPPKPKRKYNKKGGPIPRPAPRKADMLGSVRKE